MVSEVAPFQPNPEARPEPTARFAVFLQEAHNGIEREAVYEDEPYRSAFAAEFATLLQTNKSFRTAFEQVVDDNSLVRPEYIYRVATYTLRNMRDVTPERRHKATRTQPDDWQDHLLRLVRTQKGQAQFADIVSTPVNRFQKFIEVAEFQRKNVLPQNNDPYTASYETMFATLLNRSATFHAFFGEVVRDLPDVDPANIYRRTLKIFQYIETSANPETFPRNRATPESWARPLLNVVHKSASKEHFYGNIFYPIMSNVSERGIMLKAVAWLHDKRENLRILDMGCSLNDVLKRLALESNPEFAAELAFNPIEVVRRQPGQRGEPEVDAAATAAFNDWLRTGSLDMHEGVGIDPIPFDRDKRLRMRGVSDSRYMGELVLENLSKQFEILAHAPVPQVQFYSKDAANFNPADLGGKFDITYMSTMLYQLSSEAVQQILANAEEATADDGLIIVQDFVREFRRSGAIHFYKRWPKYTYGVWVKDKQRPDLGYQKYFTAYGGRIEKIIPQPALARLAIARRLGLAAEPLKQTADTDPQA